MFAAENKKGGRNRFSDPAHKNPAAVRTVSIERASEETHLCDVLSPISKYVSASVTRTRFLMSTQRVHLLSISPSSNASDDCSALTIPQNVKTVPMSDGSSRRAVLTRRSCHYSGRKFACSVDYLPRCHGHHTRNLSQPEISLDIFQPPCTMPSSSTREPLTRSIVHTSNHTRTFGSQSFSRREQSYD